MRGEARKPVWRTWLSVNRGLKGISIIAAVVLWYAIREAISFELLIEEVPVRILHDEGWALQEGDGQTVDIRFRGSRSDVRDLGRDQVVVTVDARGGRTHGAQSAPIALRDIRAPTGARPVLVRPEVIAFRLDREGEREVPVRVDVQGQVPEGFEVEQVTSVPPTVILRGPSAQLDGVQEVRTAPVELDQRIQSFRVRRVLLPPDPTWAARMEPDRVQVEVSLREHAIRREIAAVPVLALTRPGERAPRFEPAVVRVTLQARQDQLRSLEPDAVRAYIELREGDVLPGGVVPIRILAPAGVRAMEIQPATARIGPPTEGEEDDAH